MTKTKKVEIVISEIGRGTILVDGEPLQNVRSFTLKASAGQLTTLSLELVRVDVHFEGELDVTTIQDEYVRREAGKG